MEISTSQPRNSKAVRWRKAGSVQETEAKLVSPSNIGEVSGDPIMPRLAGQVGDFMLPPHCARKP